MFLRTLFLGTLFLRTVFLRTLFLRTMSVPPGMLVRVLPGRPSLVRGARTILRRSGRAFLVGWSPRGRSGPVVPLTFGARRPCA